MTICATTPARTTYEYDNYTATAPHAALTARTNISGLDSAYTTTKKTRGNVTAATRYLLTGGTVTGSVSTYQQYDVAGNVVKAIDGEGNATSFTFSDRFGVPDTEAQSNSAPVELATQQSYAYASLVTNAMNHKFFTQRDYYTGQVVNAEDPNGTVSSAYYEDPLDRPTKVIGASNDLSQVLTTQKTFAYDDTNRIVTTTSDLTNYTDGLLKSQALYDGMGRTTETRQYETATAYVMTKRTYDALGRVSRVSNPYRTGTPSWTETAYDALGRIVSVKTLDDNAAVLTSYSGNTVTVTDQAGKDRQSTTDALGKLTQIVEDPGGLGYVTNYTYDVLGNLKTVTQTGLQNGASVTEMRTFTYDSLSRLVTAANPESGTIQYKYDANGNLALKIDPRAGGASLPNCSIPYTGTNIATCYEYDALNRMTLRDYGDATPDVRYFYDAQTLPAGAPSFARGASTGRLVAVTTGGTNAGTYYGYDELGQVVRRIQRTDSADYVSDATYNKAGGVVTETRPAVPGAADRRTITYNYDGAGRLLSLNSNATTYAAGASVSNVLYAPHGALDKETLGNNLVHDVNYNTRLQPTQIRLGTSAAPTSVLDLTYNYGTTVNNGNLLDATEKIGTWTRKQVYTYDALNRLDNTSETNGSTTTYWTEDNAYDRFGNRWEVISGGTPLTFNSKNQINGDTYDLAGNLTDDTVRTYGYDAENRLRSVGAVANAFTYDGEGKRVKKDFPLQERVRFVYGVGGQLVMEIDIASSMLKKEYVYGADGLLATIEPAAGTKYTTLDHLGSPRVVTDDAGGPPVRHDYRPFGVELAETVGGRTSGQGFGVDDGLRQKFTSKERDEETGLDYFGARYYASTQRRFTSADSVQGSASNPQTLNLYAYVQNNPLKYIDPTGHTAVPFSVEYISGDLFLPLSGHIFDSEGPQKTMPKSEPLRWLNPKLATPFSPEEITKYRSRLETMIKADDCSTYLTELLGEAGLETDTTPRSILDTFDAIAKGRGGIFWKYDRKYGGTADGSIESNNAIVNVTPRPSEPFISLDRSEFLANDTTLVILGEVLHRVGPNNAYTDTAMANATNAIRVRKGLESPRVFRHTTQNDIDDASRYWHPYVDRACSPRR